MTNITLSARERALQHLEAALATNVRGDLRKKIEAAIAEAKHQEGKITELTPIGLKALSNGQRIADPQNAGLWFRRGRAGCVAIYRYRCPTDNKQRETRIGLWSEIAGEGITLSDIRSIYRKMKAQVDAGAVPTIPKAPEPVQVMGVATMVQRYLDEYARPWKRSAIDDVRILNTHLVQNFGDRPAHEVSKEDVGRIIINLQRDGKHRQAGKVRAIISKCYAFALAAPVSKPKMGQPLNHKSWLPAGSSNPAAEAHGAAYEAQTFTPKLSDRRSFMQIMQDHADQPEAQSLLLQALTFCRVNEPCRMEWGHVDLEGKTWTLPASHTKNKQPHRVVLTDPAIDVLRMAKLRSKGSQYVFPSKTDPTSNISTDLVSHWWLNKRREAGLDDGFSTHALRRDGLTWLKENGASKDVRDVLSNHKAPGIDGSYTAAANMLDQMWSWSEKWAAHLQCLTAANVSQIGEVRA